MSLTSQAARAEDVPDDGATTVNASNTPRKMTETPPSRPLLAAFRLALALAWTLVASIPQTFMIRHSGSQKIRFARFYWASICRILNLKVVTEGNIAASIRDRAATARGAKPIIFVANHTSWLDIPVFGGTLPTVFVAKQEVKTWPIIGMLARLGRTIFVSRQRNSTGREIESMGGRLSIEDNLILFPEGTSSDGSRVLPFMSSFFAVAYPSSAGESATSSPTVMIQPVSIVYTQRNGRLAGEDVRRQFAWYGDMDLAPHVWRVCQWRSMQANLIIHPPIDPKDHASRKELSAHVHRVISEGVRTLQQNAECVS